MAPRRSAPVTHPATARPAPRHERFPLGYAGIVGTLAHAVAPDERRAYVDVTDTEFTGRFGPWVVHTTLDNIAEVSISGPYHVLKVIGPPRLSLADGGLTFATNVERGVCIRFFRPVAGIEPTGRLRHSGLTVTVADPEGLIAALAS